MSEYDQTFQFLKTISPFDQIPNNLLARIADRLRMHHYGRGAVLIQAGAPGDILYILHTGLCESVFTNEEGAESIIKPLPPGSSIGIMSMLTGEPHSVTVRVREDAELFVLYKSDLDALITENPGITTYLNRILTQKIREAYSLAGQEKTRSEEDQRALEAKDRRLRVLDRISDLVSSENDLDSLLKSIVREVALELGVDACSIFLIDQVNDEIVLEANYGFGSDAVGKVRLGRGEGITGWVIENWQPALVEDARQDPRAKFFSDIREERFASLASVPLILEMEEVLGTINLQTVEPRKYSLDDARTLNTIANQIAVCIDRARLEVQATAGVRIRREERFIGEPAYVQKIEAFVASVADRSDPVLILGEGGTGRSMMARMIHWKGKRGGGPFIEVDCAELKENLWGGELFGYEKGAFVEASNRRLGFLELADGGTLLLTNVEMLAHATQVTLTHFLKTGWFSRVGGQERISPNVRVIATSTDDLRELVERGEVKLSLYQTLSANTFTIQPLRKRRRDIPLIAEHFLERIAAELHKDVKKIERAAIETLSSYDWPGNTLELENVLRRAAILTRTDTISAEQLFFGLPTVGGRAFFNLLSIDSLRNFVHGMLYPGLLQFLSVGAFLVVLLGLFLGPEDGTNNIAAILVWSIGWFGIYLMTFVAGRIWCGFCPFSTIARWIQKVGVCFHMPTPEWIKTYSGIIMAAFVLLLYWSEGMTLMYINPALTAWLFLLITAGAIFFSIMYERRVWCRYICPFGNLMGVHALSSVVALRANKKVCTSQCQSHACYIGGEKAEGCPMFLHPYGIESNRYCTLCANCIKNCPHRSIRLNIQVPAEGVLTLENYTMSGSFLALALMSVLVVENGSILGRDSLAFAKLAERVPLKFDLLYTLVFMAIVTVPFLGLWLYELVITGFDRAKGAIRLNMLGFSFIPLALAGHLAFYLGHLLHGINRLVEITGGYFGIDWRFDAARLWGMDNLKEFQHWLIIAGAAGVIYVLRNFIRQHPDIFDRKRHVLWGYGTMLGVAVYLYWKVMG